MGTMCDHVLNPSLRIHACETTVLLPRAACVACDRSLLRSLRNHHHVRSVCATGQVVREYRVSMDGHPVLHAMAGLASLAYSLGECTVLEVRRLLALVVVRAFQHS